jgi:CheY-like chemotaxis protein
MARILLVDDEKMARTLYGDYLRAAGHSVSAVGNFEEVQEAGSPIEAQVIEELRQAYSEETITFPWQQGDILMLDNMLVAHGRAPYAGDRKILVSMGQPQQRADV